jgi:hypothetical protein
MRSFESMINRFQLTRKELEVKSRFFSLIFYLYLNFFKTIINENEILYTRQQELDVLLVELDRYLHNLTTNYETFESIQKDNRRELEIKLDKHQVR